MNRQCNICKKGTAVTLLMSVQCSNRNCRNYDSAWAKEVAQKEAKQFSKHIRLKHRSFVQPKKGKGTRSGPRKIGLKKKKRDVALPTMPW